MHLPISVIIPTLNEEHALPNLLHSLENQTMPPSEIIVADAFSKDNTREIARNFGCIVVNGGMPAEGRNNGAKAASKNLLLFLDADVILPKKFLEKTYFEMVEKDLDIASCLATPRSRDPKDKMITAFWNSYFLFLENVSPHVCGFCIFARKSIHRKLEGFDETILVGEDVDYAQRAATFGKFRFLSSQKIPISLRRFIEEGRLKMIMKHIGITLHMLFIGHVRSDIFDYKFGQHREM
ncbi:MAG: glycosyltransferase [Patescibacteria group bacterium]|nr:glycosyltransferase [Patescibacteria group bacterium]MDE2589663.1 glycosyltransferase [Patescibacteria group bacterium]